MNLNFKEFFNRKIVEALGRKSQDTIAREKQIEENRIADLKQYEDYNSQLFNIWTNEILVNKKIVEEYSNELFAGINDSFFNNKGKIVDKSPKSRLDYDSEIKKEAIYMRIEGKDSLVLKHEKSYKPCEVTLKANYVSYSPASCESYMGETIEYGASVGVDVVGISIRVDGGKTGISYLKVNDTAKIISIEENISKIDKKIVLSYFTNSQGRITFSFPFPDLTKKIEMDQLREEISEKLATLITNNIDFPFTELSKNADNFLFYCGDREYINTHICRLFLTSDLVNGKKINEEGMKKYKEKYIFTK